MREIEFARAARRDVAAIRRESEVAWGAEQRDSYVGALEQRVGLLRTHPEMGPVYGRHRPGLRRLHIGSHVVFYRVDDIRVHVIRILHQRMDFERYLGQVSR